VEECGGSRRKEGGGVRVLRLEAKVIDKKEVEKGGKGVGEGEGRIRGERGGGGWG